MADGRVSRSYAGTFDADAMVMLDANQQIAQIVLDHPETAAVFQRLTLDFCCHGNQRLADACADAGYNAVAILRELDAAITARARAADDPRGYSTAKLVQHIITHHHDYLRGALPTIASLATKVASVHGMRDPKLYDLATAVRDLSEALLPHIDDEEAVVFPALLATTPDPTALARMFESMEEEHQEVGGLLRAIRNAASDYIEPEWACRTYRTLCTELVRLEADTLRHVHLENHVLAPRFGGAS